MTSRTKENKYIKRIMFIFLLLLISLVSYNFLPPLQVQAAYAADSNETNVLTLEDALKIAKENNKTLQAQYYQMQSAKETYIQALGYRLPNITGSLSYERIRAMSTNNASYGSKDNFSYSLDANQLLYDFGATNSYIQSAYHSYKQSEKQYLDTLRQIEYQVKQSYLNVLSAEQLYDTAKEGLDLANLILKYTQSEFDVGLVARSDVLSAEVEVQNAKISLLNAKNQINVSLANLANVLGYDPRKSFTISKTAYETPPKAIASNFADQIFSIAIKNRPDIAAAIEGIDAARYTLKNLKSSLYPKINLVGDYSRSDTKFPPENYSWFYGITATITFYNGGQNLSKIRQEQDILNSLIKTKDNLEDSIKLAVWTDILNLNNAYSTFELSDAAVKSALENLRVNEAQYREGLNSIIDLTTARNNYISAKNQRIINEYNYYLSLAALERDLGVKFFNIENY
ncbi:outer membrane efflux protein [Thermodesulfobium narugense DSM 14796]|uniref:Outer membrane efflux protein n=1 Tax=Thermodesulfobium narugense DSM 14796 TaxID=747365 RepID=M1E8Z7_9BACT|nr:TolC family protein [Thermodesulfobium narugense]AEE14754.1 outer membrane efflux protein [Thermodesulfobium narugense DSM 14796]